MDASLNPGWPVRPLTILLVLPSLLWALPLLLLDLAPPLKAGKKNREANQMSLDGIKGLPVAEAEKPYLSTPKNPKKPKKARGRSGYTFFGQQNKYNFIKEIEEIEKHDRASSFRCRKPAAAVGPKFVSYVGEKWKELTDEERKEWDDWGRDPRVTSGERLINAQAVWARGRHGSI